MGRALFKASPGHGSELLENGWDLLQKIRHKIGKALGYLAVYLRVSFKLFCLLQKSRDLTWSKQFEVSTATVFWQAISFSKFQCFCIS